jgi:hypothetical protein
MSGTNPGHRSSSGKNSGNSVATGAANYEAKSGSYNYATANSPTTEATMATSGFCHSRSAGVLGGVGGVPAIKWNGIGGGSEGGIGRHEAHLVQVLDKAPFRSETFLCCIPEFWDIFFLHRIRYGQILLF